jgi:hypothetical protein
MLAKYGTVAGGKISPMKIHCESAGPVPALSILWKIHPYKGSTTIRNRFLQMIINALYTGTKQD